MSDTENDRLRRLITNADPTSALADLRRDQIIRLTENAMSQTTSPRTASRRRGLLAGGFAALAAGAAAAIVIPLGLGATSSTVLEQPASGGPAASCATVVPEGVARADSAFRATVATIEGDTVTLDVIDRFAGDVDDTVTVAQGTDTGVDGEPITFEAGTTYLISTTQGMIITCGVSGPDSPELSSIYDQAFPG